MDGIINLDKPFGKTSFQMVANIRRLTGERHVGHAGTLDPAATGVLPVCLGQGTRVVDFLQDATKSYRAEIEFGITTDTYDATGEIISRADSSAIKETQLLSLLKFFCGVIQQKPPMFSALKHNGQKLYELAREGVNIERKTRPVKIYKIELTGWRPPVATIEVTCGKGTYIRSLAYDLGEALGCGAYLKSLVRTRYGLFDIKNAVSLSQFEDAVRCGYWQELVYPIDCVLSDWAAIVVNEAACESIKNGRSVTLEPDFSGENRCRAYALDGRFLGVLRFNTERKEWQPEKVFS